MSITSDIKKEVTRLVKSGEVEKGFLDESFALLKKKKRTLDDNLKIVKTLLNEQSLILLHEVLRNLVADLTIELLSSPPEGAPDSDHEEDTTLYLRYTNEDGVEVETEDFFPRRVKTRVGKGTVSDVVFETPDAIVDSSRLQITESD